MSILNDFTISIWIYKIFDLLIDQHYYFYVTYDLEFGADGGNLIVSL